MTTEIRGSTEVIVVDDGCGDGTVAHLQPPVEGGRIRLLRQPNGGMTAARHLSLRHAAAELVVFLDHDDRWTPDTLQWQEDVMAALPELSLVAGRVQWVDVHQR